MSQTALRIYVVDQAGEEHELEALEGWRVMEVIRDWGLDIKAECGGPCACATLRLRDLPRLCRRGLGRPPASRHARGSRPARCGFRREACLATVLPAAHLARDRRPEGPSCSRYGARQLTIVRPAPQAY